MDGQSPGNFPIRGSQVSEHEYLSFVFFFSGFLPDQKFTKALLFLDLITHLTSVSHLTSKRREKDGRNANLFILEH
jgi:hypothetical protein